MPNRSKQRKKGKKGKKTQTTDARAIEAAYEEMEAEIKAADEETEAEIKAADEELEAEIKAADEELEAEIKAIVDAAKAGRKKKIDAVDEEIDAKIEVFVDAANAERKERKDAIKAEAKRNLQASKDRYNAGVADADALLQEARALRAQRDEEIATAKAKLEQRSSELEAEIATAKANHKTKVDAIKADTRAKLQASKDRYNAGVERCRTVIAAKYSALPGEDDERLQDARALRAQMDKETRKLLLDRKATLLEEMARVEAEEDRVLVTLKAEKLVLDAGFEAFRAYLKASEEELAGHDEKAAETRDRGRKYQAVWERMQAAFASGDIVRMKKEALVVCALFVGTRKGQG